VEILNNAMVEDIMAKVLLRHGKSKVV